MLHFIPSNADLTDVWQNKKKIFFCTSNVYPMWGIKSKTGYYISLGDWSQPVQYLACFTTVHPKMDSRGFLPTHTTRGELQRLVWTSVFLSFLAFALNTYGFHIRFFYPTKGMLHMQCFKNGIQIHVHGFTVFSLVLAQFHFREKH